MATVGNLGSLITFKVSTGTVLTIEKMTQTVKGRWATHSIIGGRPKTEFLGPELRSISFPVLLSAMQGVKPRTVMEAIESAIESGENYKFVIGGKRVGSNNWVVTNMSESWDTVIKDGKLAQAKVTLTLQEYV